MTAPDWIDAIVRDFGRSAGLSDFALNDRGAAAAAFDNGVTLRFEYASDALVVAVTVPTALDAERARALLAYAHPDAGLGARVRAGYLTRRGSAVFAVRLYARDATLPAVNRAFEVLWRVAMEFGGAA